MPSTAEAPRDPGLAAERTALAWQRMALGFTSMAAVMLAAAAHRGDPWLLAPSVALFAVAAAVWRYARRRTGDRALRTARRPVALLAYATAAAAVAAAALSLIRPG
jgi:uncharacterized membrane protein YidH (DUF202 family)